MTMPKIETWFPVSIYSEENVLSVEQNDVLKNHCLQIPNTAKSGGDEWIGGTYTTHGTYDLSKDKKFDLLIDNITYHVHQFAKMHNCTETYKSAYAWMNIAKEADYQEFHTHNGCVFSAVYYVSAPEGSGRIVFEDPKEPDMCPLKTKTNRNDLSCSRVGYAPMAGTLLIFRSYLRHCVEPGTNNDPRISIALNFS